MNNFTAMSSDSTYSSMNRMDDYGFCTHLETAYDPLGNDETGTPVVQLPSCRRTKRTRRTSAEARASLQSQYNKKKGPKFKYVYDCPEEAAEARRARNRATALASYRKKREHMANVEREVAALEKEREALMHLLEEVEAGKVGVTEEGDISRYLVSVTAVAGEDEDAVDRAVI